MNTKNKTQSEIDYVKSKTRGGVEKESRKVFAGHHVAEQKNEGLYQRKFARMNYEYLQLPEGWFKGKNVLDVASGTALTNTHKLLELGANVTAMDLPSDEPFDESRIKDQFKGRYKLVRGNLLDLPFEGNSFDFVVCDGALHHTVDAKKGFMELARVTKPKGYVYIMVVGSQGVFRIWEDALREEYKTNKHRLNLKEWVDNLTVEKLHDMLRFINDNLKNEDKHIMRIPLDIFDEDFVVTIKDRLQAPIYSRYTQYEVFGWYKEAGFKNTKRVTRYPFFRNIKRYMNPVYEQYDHPISKFLNGEGFLQVIGQKG